MIYCKSIKDSTIVNKYTKRILEDYSFFVNLKKYKYANTSCYLFYRDSNFFIEYNFISKNLWCLESMWTFFLKKYSNHDGSSYSASVAERRIKDLAESTIVPYANPLVMNETQYKLHHRLFYLPNFLKI